MGRDTRITFIDENNDRHDGRLPREDVVIASGIRTVTVDLHHRWTDWFPGIPVAAMKGWEVVITDGELDVTYSGMIEEISPFGLIIREA
ncbi:hypothetical protein CV102_14030 [Natronococcus pandeyae]|uniref:Uncharacterized protein n=1 Tax=Natronococcus pandeyae TaxID=2055836 RepID=A0A8J8Q3L7_9EURY|nr:hypothetical protein [Natronococcus pandeyae]TYL37848.1 hypothetical protein CV102_14030 [Natronococcus pandeyae]